MVDVIMSIKGRFLLVGTTFGPRFNKSSQCFGISSVVRLKMGGLIELVL